MVNRWTSLHLQISMMIIQKKSSNSKFKSKSKKNKDCKNSDSWNNRKILKRNRINWESSRKWKSYRKHKKRRYKRRAKDGHRLLPKEKKLIMVCLWKIIIGCRRMSHRALKSSQPTLLLIKMAEVNKIWVILTSH